MTNAPFSCFSKQFRRRRSRAFELKKVVPIQAKIQKDANAKLERGIEKEIKMKRKGLLLQRARARARSRFDFSDTEKMFFLSA